jgi:hypothetical protein
MTRLLLAITAVAFLGLGLAVHAHHSFAAEFDANRPVTLHGTVVRMQWINPHPWIHIAVKGPDGNEVVWMIEASAPNTLIRRGFTRDSLPVGTVITVEGYQARDGSNRANGTDLTFPDGRKVFLSSNAPGSGGR